MARESSTGPDAARVLHNSILLTLRFSAPDVAAFSEMWILVGDVDDADGNMAVLVVNTMSSSRTMRLQQKL